MKNFVVSVVAFLAVTVGAMLTVFILEAMSQAVFGRP
jgi:hypothetical protein